MLHMIAWKNTIETLELGSNETLELMDFGLMRKAIEGNTSYKGKLKTFFPSKIDYISNTYMVFQYDMIYQFIFESIVWEFF